MSRRKQFQSRIEAARTVRDIMCRSGSLDCNQPKLRSLCALLYCVACDEPKASYKYKLSEARKYSHNEIEEYEKSDDSIIVDSLSDLVVMAIGVLIEKLSDDVPQSIQEERAEFAGIRIKKEIFAAERMILEEEEVVMREEELKKKEESTISVQYREKERLRKAKNRTKEKNEIKKLVKVRKIMEDEEAVIGMEQMEYNNEMRQWNGMKSEPFDDEYPSEINPNQRLLNLCEPLPSSSRMEDDDDVTQIEPSNFMTRTRARMERLGRLSERLNGRGGVVGGTAVIKGVKRVHSTVFHPNSSNVDYSVNISDSSYNLPRTTSFNPMSLRPGASLLKGRLGRLSNEYISPSSSSQPTQTLRSILHSEISTPSLVPDSVRRRMQPYE